MFLQKSFISGLPKVRQALTVVPCRGKKSDSAKRGIPARTRWRHEPRKVDPALFNSDFTEPLSASVNFGDIAEQRRVHEFADDLRSMTARGFLRFQKEYIPPQNAVEKFLNLVRSLNPKLTDMSDELLRGLDLSNPDFKYEVLSKAATEFKHSVPNSMLSAIRTIGVAAEFYDTPIQTITPFDSLQQMPDLPPNLYVQKDYIRFTDETSHLYGGITAFPRDTCIVTGLRSREKYKGYKAPKTYVGGTKV